MDFELLRRTCRLTLKDCTAFFGVTTRTIRNWDTGSAPLYAIRFLTYLSKDLSFHNKAWRGFYFDGEVIITPCKTAVSPGDILSIPYLVQTINLTRLNNTNDIH